MNTGLEIPDQVRAAFWPGFNTEDSQRIVAGAGRHLVVVGHLSGQFQGALPALLESWVFTDNRGQAFSGPMAFQTETVDNTTADHNGLPLQEGRVWARQGDV